MFREGGFLQEPGVPRGSAEPGPGRCPSTQSKCPGTLDTAFIPAGFLRRLRSRSSGVRLDSLARTPLALTL